MHATTMIFLFVMPIGAAFANYLMPLQIGARDVAFPRLNAFSFWCFLVRRHLPQHVVVPRRGADGGWFMYAAQHGVIFSPSHGIDFWTLGLHDHRHRVAHRRDQPDRHRAQHARARA